VFEQAPRYDRMRDFQALIGAHDPNHKFGNAFLDRYVYPDAALTGA
jgi:hypothetical protein